MCELKKIGKVFTSNLLGLGPRLIKKKNLPGRGLTKVKKHWCRPQALIDFALVEHVQSLFSGCWQCAQK